MRSAETSAGRAALFEDESPTHPHVVPHMLSFTEIDRKSYTTLFRSVEAPHHRPMNEICRNVSGTRRALRGRKPHPPARRSPHAVIYRDRSEELHDALPICGSASSPADE